MAKYYGMMTGDPAMDAEERRRRMMLTPDAERRIRLVGAAQTPEAQARTQARNQAARAKGLQVALAPTPSPTAGMSIDPATGLPYTGALKPGELQPGEYGMDRGGSLEAAGALARERDIASARNVSQPFEPTPGPTPGKYEKQGWFDADRMQRIEGESALAKKPRAAAPAPAAAPGLNLRGEPTPTPRSTIDRGEIQWQGPAGERHSHYIGTGLPISQRPGVKHRREMENAVRARELNEARRAAAEPAQAQRAGEAEVSEMEAQTEGTRYIAKHPEIAILATTQPIAFHAAMQKRAVQRQAIMDRFKMAQAQKDAPGMQAAQTKLAALDAQPVTLEQTQAGPPPLPEGTPPAVIEQVRKDEEERAMRARGYKLKRTPVPWYSSWREPSGYYRSYEPIGEPSAVPATQPVTAPQSAGSVLPPQAFSFEPIVGPPAVPATQPVTAPQSAGPALPPQAWGEPIEQKMVGGQLTATNTRTGQKLVWKDGRWQPLA